MLRLFCRWWSLHMWVGNWFNQWCGGCYGFWSFVIVLMFFCLNDGIWCIMLRSCWSYWNHRDTWYNGCRFLNFLQTNHIFTNHNIFNDDNSFVYGVVALVGLGLWIISSKQTSNGFLLMFVPMIWKDTNKS